MHIRDLSGSTVCVLGYGREGRATVSALEEHAPGCEITIADRNDAIAKKIDTTKHWAQCGTGWLANLKKFDVLIVSPGIPPQPEFEAVQDKLTNATQIFLDSIADTGATVIGITGSKGKSTTASLLQKILQEAGKNTHLIGNIGEPALAYLKRARLNTFFVQEMSSYQLMHVTRSPHIAVVTSFFPEHLTYHGSLEAYEDAKSNIALHQQENDVVFYCVSSEGARRIAKKSPATVVPYSASNAPVAPEETHLRGTHNQENIAAAWKVASHLGIPKDIAMHAIKDFKGLPHRMQSLGIIGGVQWIDDAISTTPESTIAALTAFGDDIDTIILGGQDRGNDFTELATLLAHSSIANLILLPENGDRIASVIDEKIAFAKNKHIERVATLEEAVAAAKKHTTPGKSCLLSPASPSYNQFKNFEEKGDAFRMYISQKTRCS